MNKSVDFLKAARYFLEGWGHLGNFVVLIPGNFYWKDRGGRYLGCNNLLLKTLGMNFPSDLIGKTDHDLWPEQAEELLQNDTKVMSSGQPVYLDEKVTRDSREMFFTVIKAPLRDDSGNIIGIVGNSLDVTDQVETKKALEIAKNQAETALRAKEELERVLREKSVDLQKVLQDMIQQKYYLTGKYKGIYLTKREAECLVCLARNMSMKEIAKVLKIKPRTVEMFLENARGKLNCHTKSQLVQAAIECRFLEGVRPVI